MLISVFLPFLNFLGLSLFGRFLGKLGTIYWLFLNTTLTVLFNICFIGTVLKYNTCYYLSLGSWVDVHFLEIGWDFVIDPLAGIMLSMVSVISALVHWYSIDYMKNDPHFIRFMSFLSLFTFFMFVLVTAGNFVQIFLGWEGVGICSYLLINFWTTRVQAGKAAIKAVLMNRVGDICFIIAIALVYHSFYTLDFHILPLLTPWINLFYETNFEFFNYECSLETLICFCILLGVVAKSAQVGLHTWIPAAMEGPTPVSALIHAATMVTAGIFIVIRVSFFFELSEVVLGLATCIGAITAFISALSALFLYDIKRIIAYSTCSQLGYMLFAAGLSQYGISLFHLINHAFFKALLFLTAGAIIHSFSNEQDIRKLSSVYKRSPFLFTALFIGNIAIMGLPFLAGFYSKDLIIEAALLRLPQLFSDRSSVVLLGLIGLATCLTALYSCRVVYYLVFKQRQVSFSVTSILFFEQPFFIKIVLSVLMFFSIFSGYFLSDFFSESSLGSLQVNLMEWSSSLFFELEFLNTMQKIVPIVLNSFILFLFLFFLWVIRRTCIDYKVVLIGLPFGKIVRQIKGSFFEYFGVLFYFFYHLSSVQFCIRVCTNNFYYNELYNFFSSFFFYSGYTSIFLTFDKGMLEYIGPLGFSSLYQKWSSIVIRWYKQPFRVHLFTLYLVILTYFYLFVFFL